MLRREFLGQALALPFACNDEARDRLLVVDSVGNCLIELDPRTLQRTGKVGLDRRPRKIVATPDGRTAYVSIFGPGVFGNNPTPGRSIAMIDLTAMKVAKKLTLGTYGGPHALALAPDGRLWTTCESEGAVLLVDPAFRGKNGAVASVVPLGMKGTRHLVLTPDGMKLYAASVPGSMISVVDTKERRLAGEIRIEGGVAGLAVAPDGRRLFATDASRPILWVIDVAEDTVVKRQALDELATGLLATPDGASLLVAHEESRSVSVLDVPSLRKRGRVAVGRSPSGLAVPDDGVTGFAASWVDGTVAAFSLDPVRGLKTGHPGGGPDGLVVTRRPTAAL